MKFCPVCQTRYDEEILRFCTKDGAPLIEENPTFAEMPSESEEIDDISEETLIRRNAPPSEIPAAQPGDKEDFGESAPVQRIVIPTKEEKEPVRAKVVSEPRYEQPRQKSNTALIVLVTMLGTLIVLGALGGIGYFLSNRNSADSNSNKTININTNPPLSNSDIETNSNANGFLEIINSNTNTNVNANINVNVATPTRTPTPTPTRTPNNENTNSNSNVNLGNTNVMTRPSPSPGETPLASPTPRVSPTPEATPAQTVNVGIMNSRAVNLVKPAYPPNAKQVNATGQVNVQISVDEDGNVLSAKAVTGHPLLRPAAENAARQSRFNPVKINDKAVKALGVVVYNFINQ